ncbi:hypothetical protein G6F37_007961 [Rhizopus arrhizus]|nr:hypothetical protein G6F38_008101 [Rhizopus arrhizus]KAG1156057.1 hypothetical protein G6F37_007961 [Rhizopus arrhizus]
MVVYKDSLACWHEEKIDDVEFRKLWTERFNSIKAAVIKHRAPTTSLLEICTDITDDIELKCKRRKTKSHLEIETLRTQRFVTTTSNKRLRAEIENEATSSQSSQSSYEPNTDTSEDVIDDLEPTKLATNENEHAEKIALEHMGNDNLRVCCKVLYNLLQTYTRTVNLQAVDESMYITLSINPFIDVIFGYNCDLSKAGNFTKLEGSSHIKPDIKYSAIIKQYKMDFLVIEVKCPNSNANDDLFKLSIEMQILLNRLVNVGIGFPVAYEFMVSIISCFNCDIFKMDLKAPAIY